MFLFRVTDGSSSSYYWARNSEEAGKDFCADFDHQPENISTERVWANNTDIRYRGYVAKEEREWDGSISI